MTDPPRLSLRLFGEVTLSWSGQVIPPPGPKLLALLAYLHLRGKVSREELTEVFWPGKKSGLQSVRQALTQLRKLAGSSEWLTEDAAGLSLLAVSDVSEFHRLIAAGDNGTALALANGELLASLPAPSETFSNWLAEERAALSTQYAQAMRRHGQALLEAGDFLQARLWLAAALEQEGPEEGLYRALMELEAQAGDPARALELFEECCLMLQTELGVSPSPETLALLERIEGQGAGRHQSGQLLSDVAALPQATEPLYGREVVRQNLLSHLMPGTRVLLYGLGGLGKTRLASAVASSFVERGQKVVWLEVGADSAPTVLGTLRELLREPVGDLSGALAREQVGLLILDNAANTYTVGQVLAALPPGLPVLVTSRLRLPRLKAIELSRLDRESALWVLQHHLGSELLQGGSQQDALCALLGDHPFALRLAARTLAQGDTDLMQALYAAPQDIIRALLEQSLTGLSPRSYEVFLAMGSLYAPQATPELLSELLARPQEEIEDALWHLAQAGLLSRESRAGSDTLCFRMHDLTWHAARERRAHLPHHLVSAVTTYAGTYTHNPDLLGTDLPHLLGAAQTAPPATLTRLMCGWLGGSYIGARGFPTAALHLLEQATQYAEGCADWETASLLGGKHADIAQALLGQNAEAIARLLRAAVQAGKAGNVARQAVQLALAGQMQAAAAQQAGEADVATRDEAWEHLRQAQALARHADPVTQARVLGQVAIAHAYQKEFVKARDLLGQARDILRGALETANGDRAVLGAYLSVLGNLGQAEKRLGHLNEALKLKREMGDLAAEKDERLYQARAALDQGELLHELGQPDEALHQLRFAIELSQSLGAGKLEGMARRLLQDIASAN